MYERMSVQYEHMSIHELMIIMSMATWYTWRPFAARLTRQTAFDPKLFGRGVVSLKFFDCRRAVERDCPHPHCICVICRTLVPGSLKVCGKVKVGR